VNSPSGPGNLCPESSLQVLSTFDTSMRRLIAGRPVYLLNIQLYCMYVFDECVAGHGLQNVLHRAVSRARIADQITPASTKYWSPLRLANCKAHDAEANHHASYFSGSHRGSNNTVAVTVTVI
jgi:hypothetical protein